MDGILHITSDKTAGFGWDFTCNGRQDTRIWMGFYISWHTRQKALDGIPPIMTDKTIGLETVYI